MERTLLRVMLVVGIIGASFAVALPASAQVITVLPGESIHLAVKSAQPGDTIQLTAGVYEDVVAVKTNGITIQGVGSDTNGTILRPPADLPGRCFRGIAGICILGNFQDGTPVEGVTITGVRAEGFIAAGIISILSRNTTFEGNAGIGSQEYGLAGIYIGDTRRARAVVEGNESFDNTFGLFLRDVSLGDITANQFHDNCIGILNLDTPGPVRAGRFTISENTIEHNNAFCRGQGRGEPSTGGSGIVILGGRGNTIQGNVIARNRTSRNVPFHGGVVLVEHASNNTVTGNTLLRNRPNIFTDGSGSGNQVSGNTCTPGC